MMKIKERTQTRTLKVLKRIRVWPHLPELCEGVHQLVHHWLGVVRRGRHAETLGAAGNSGVVDGLDVHAVFLNQLV